MRPAVFLDRDGTINEEVNYLSSPEEFKLIPGAGEAIRLFNQAGFAVVVITNQSGLARGYFTEETLQKIHQKMCKDLAAHGARIDAIYYCPHHPDDHCSCRKPKTGLVERAAKELGLDLKKSYVIGDRYLDLLLARNIGAKGVLVLTGYGREELEKKLPEIGLEPDIIARDLLDAAKRILQS
ncbi:D-glycero-beta-D-manno-heptose 1,7-bisphosphate 7-phosphatase [Thermodesulfatator atlanticus]|uniref:D-glycero-beta-D-manno-heptose 1,7-bisphosphate 7-phosphatase n=1 Tax=Thermodesulfatator atlanticus TaxID=501497 RepID=UPI0003B68602|nr:D-glycero-beta-D-manno-heptose 1,7-bisphosphate 7-phosphatase [Thermodesulfatator atlanticus]